MVTNIYLVRHAQSAYTPDELNRPLSQRGSKDAERVAEILLSENINFVISSPYKRSIQTVEIVAKNIGGNIAIKNDFRERKIAEVPVEDFDNAMDKLWKDFNFAFEGGESNLKAQIRGISALNEVLNDYKGKNIVIGTHGNIMVLIMNYFDKAYDYSFWCKLSMPDIYKLSFLDGKFIEAQRVWEA